MKILSLSSPCKNKFFFVFNGYYLHMNYIVRLTFGRKCFMTAMRPLIPISLSGRNPSGVTKYISRREFLATIKFKSVVDVKFPN